MSELVNYDLQKNGKIVITDTTAARPDLVGVITPWLWDRGLGVQVVLNREQKAMQLNGNRFEPIMMTNVRGVNPNVPAYFNQVVVCEQGTQVQFNLSSWGAAGYGYRIRPDRGVPIAERLYICFGRDGFGKRCNGALQRYQQAQQLIEIVSTQSMQIPGKDAIPYMKVTVQSWRLRGFKASNGETFRSDAMPPLTYDVDRPPDFRGELRGGVIPGDAVVMGMPRPGEASAQSFGSISDVEQDNPDANQVLGEVVFYFFVFKDRETAAKVILGVNSPDGSPYQ